MTGYIFDYIKKTITNHFQDKISSLHFAFCMAIKVTHLIKRSIHFTIMKNNIIFYVHILIGNSNANIV